MIKPISGLGYRCSLRVRNFNEPGHAMSDCCGTLATSAVVMENGNKMWRCPIHRGVRYMETGPVVTMISIKETA